MKDHASYWEQTTFLAPFDILVIGSGIVGCVAALHCMTVTPGLRVGIVERGSLPLGASTRNAGFACFGSISEISNDIASMGEQATIDLVRKRKSGLQRLFQLVAPQSLHYEPTGGYEIFLDLDEGTYQQCLRTIERLRQPLSLLFGGDPYVPDDSVIEKLGLHRIAHIIRHPYEGVLHPGKMMEQLIQLVHHAGIAMINGFEIQQLLPEERHVRVIGEDQRMLKTRYVIVATNAFAGQLIPGLPLQAARNQVYMTQPVPDLKLKGCFHYDHGYIYFREAEGRILIGGARNVDFEGENTSEFGLTDQIRQRLMDFLRQHILHGKEVRFDYAWSGIIGIGNEKAPIVKMVDERIAVAARLSGMGVAIGSLVGSQAAELILSRL